jgi:hypothetical protein
VIPTNKIRAEFGDFQTPLKLAREACSLLAGKGLAPASVLEPTCGTGTFLIAALDQYQSVRTAVGLDISDAYVKQARRAISKNPYTSRVRLISGNFFETRWTEILRDLPDPLLVIGNLPWVTNAALGSLGSSNLPVKSNFQKHRGLDAITGKGNFDISEWMMLRVLEWLSGRRATFALLCKTSVARKVFVHAWKQGSYIARSEMYTIRAPEHFRAAVDACFLVCTFEPRATNCDCAVYPGLGSRVPGSIFGYRDHRLIADIDLYERWKHLAGPEVYKWRSGIKHDCAQVLELERDGSQFKNRLGDKLDIEDTYVYPMLKSSDLASSKIVHPTRWMLVPQRSVGEDTNLIRAIAPKTWKYLTEHAELLDQRASSIYKDRPRFSVFGVGEYSFLPWKVAISGFYKHFNFKLVGTYANKPVMLDDTAYFIGCKTKDEAECLTDLLNTRVAKDFFSAFVFWDAKRPITVDLLRRLNPVALAKEVCPQGRFHHFLLNEARIQQPLI